MNKELFGIFGDIDAFRRLRQPEAFDHVVEGEAVTVGVRDPALGIPNRTAVAADDRSTAVLWGEAFAPDGTDREVVSWLRDRYLAVGTDALDGLNGSFLAVVERDGRAIIATDPIRSRECFYADTPVGRAFGTDPVAVAATIPSPSLRKRAVLELFHLSVVTGDRTVIAELHRAPFDGYLGPESTGQLERFVYEPREFDYVDELANRLQRAMDRRAGYPGRRGLMLSGGYDSRTVLAGIDGLDCAFTIGRLDGEVIRTARRLARQYDTPHGTLPIDDRYLPVDRRTIQYGQGIKESIQIHHAGYAPAIDVDVIYHALLFDTFLRGHFLPRDDVDVLGHTLPRMRLDPNPDIVETVLTRYGILPESESIFPTCDIVEAESAAEFVTTVVEDRMDEWTDRCPNIYDAIELFGIQNQPTTPFRTHLSDTHLESFIAADAELLDWHLTTPPEYRNTRTFLQAAKRIDTSILRHPPHDRPHASPTINEVEQFVRRKLPFVEPFDPAWPNHARLYEQRDLDTHLFAAHPEIHHLPPRLKLRIHDVTNWIGMAAGNVMLDPLDIVCPEPESIPTTSPTPTIAALLAPND